MKILSPNVSLWSTNLIIDCLHCSCTKSLQISRYHKYTLIIVELYKWCTGDRKEQSLTTAHVEVRLVKGRLEEARLKKVTLVEMSLVEMSIHHILYLCLYMCYVPCTVCVYVPCTVYTVNHAIKWYCTAWTQHDPSMIPAWSRHDPSMDQTLNLLNHQVHTHQIVPV